MPGGPTATGEELVQAVRAGTLSEAELDKAVRNILKFVDDYASNRKENAAIDRDACRELSRKMAGECAVLLKNDGILPLSKEAKVVFIGEFAETPRYQGAGSSHVHVPLPMGAVEAARGLRVTYVRGYDSHEAALNPALAAEAVEAAKEADVAVVFAGLPNSFETEGCDRDSLDMPEGQNELIARVAGANPNTVVVLHGGAPMVMPWFDRVPGVLLMHLGGERVGQAAVDILFGDRNPSGHLAETWPLRLEDNPSYLNFPGEDGVVDYHEDIFIGYRYYDKKKMAVRFPFGYGLSYTSFAYSGLRADKAALRDTDTLTVSCDVTNTGSRAGKAVVQLYVRDVESSVRRPVRELKGFQKIELAPGETKTVSFRLDKRSFAYYETRCHDWFVETGDFRIEIGENCRDIRQSMTVYLESSQGLPMEITALTTIGQLTRHPKGKVFVQQMMAAQAGAAQGDAAEQAGNMGEGSEKMVQRMQFEMPIGALVSYGVLSAGQLEGILRMLNG